MWYFTNFLFSKENLPLSVAVHNQAMQHVPQNVPSVLHQASIVRSSTSIAAMVNTAVVSAPSLKQELIVPPPTAVGNKHAHQQALQENEQFALAWLRATFEPVLALTSRIEQQDLYKMYMTASTKIGRQGVVSPVHFPRCVRSVFGGTVGPNSIKMKQNNAEGTALYYEGIRIRAKPLAVIHKGTILVKYND